MRHIHNLTFISIVLMGAISLFLFGCSGGIGLGDVLKTVESAKDISDAVQDISVEEEYVIGRSVAAMLAGQFPPYNEEKANAYLNELGQMLAKVSDRPETFGGYHFQIMESEDVNAFAAPGGFIFVTRGILRCAKNEDALASVLAHEIAHVQYKHGLQVIKKSRVTSTATNIAVDVAGSQIGGLGGLSLALLKGSISDMTATLVTNGYSREFEYEADRGAVEILKRVGYNPNGLIDMLNVMKTQLKPDGQDFAKTHPAPADRIAKIEKIIGAYASIKPNTVRDARFKAAVGDI